MAMEQEVATQEQESAMAQQQGQTDMASEEGAAEQEVVYKEQGAALRNHGTMKVLLHMCCGPCSLYPLKMLENERMDVVGFFYRHNIHPFSECVRRETTLMEYAKSKGVKVICQQSYEIEQFIQSVVFREKDRCRFCYHDRLNSAAKVAKKGKFDAFSSTLLYSKFQNHDLIREIGEYIGKDQGVPFLYRDFREGWKEGIEESKQLNMYRQQYCGCIYSEKDRFYRASR